MDLKEYCGGEVFFNFSKVFESSSPEFSRCFEHTVFDLAPCAFLLVFGIPYFVVTLDSFQSYIPKSKLFFSKLAVVLALWILAWINFGRAIWEWYHGVHVAYYDLVSPLLVSVGMATAAFFIHFDRLKGVRSSGLLACFWILYIVFWALIFKSQVQLLIGDKPLTDGEVWRCVTFFLSYACVLAQFIMSFFVDKLPALPPKDPYADESELLGVLHDDTLEEEVKKLKPCPENSSSFFSQMLFEWFTSIIWRGYKRPLVDADLFDLNRDDKAGRVSRKFLKIWNAEKAKYKNFRQFEDVPTEAHGVNSSDEEVLIQQPAKKKQKGPSLFKALVKAFGPFFFLSSCLKVLNDVLIFVSPQLLKLLIAFTKAKEAPLWQGYLLAVLLFVTAIFQSVVLQQYFHVCFISGMRLRSGIVAAIYRKALVLSNAARKESTVGEVVNLMSVDAQRFMDLMSYVNILWSGPFQIILAMYFLWNILGVSTLAGLAVMVLLIPVNGFIASLAHKLQIKQMKHKDERIKLMNEILNGIKVLKMYAWELSFRDKITEIRTKELKVLRSAAYLNAAASFTWTCAPFLVSLTSFAVYVLSDSSHVLDASTAFVSLSLFNILQFPLIMLPIMISSLVQANVSLNRLWKFLTNDELDLGNVDHASGPGPVISIENGTFSWESTDSPTLQNINLSVSKGSLVAVVGQVGSGKSSMISSLLGEMQKIDGSVSVKGSVAYVAQQAWIQNLTVRDNILFGKPVNPCSYQDTIAACALKEDFEMLPAGDQTEIGERGINLSGGQKQRVSIARAVYQDAQVYLLDDPLSAVDAHVGKHIFDNVLGPNGCLKSKTRVLVTHSVAFLPQVDQIVVLVDGKISEVGSYNELLDKNGAFAEFLRNYANTDDDAFDDELEVPASPVLSSVTDDDSIEPVVDTGATVTGATRRQFQRQRSRKSLSESLTGRKRTISERQGVCKMPENKKAQDDKLMTTETAETGNVKGSVFLSYIRSVGILVSVLIVLTYITSNALSAYSSIWLAEWTNEGVVNGTQNDTAFRLEIYGVLGISRALFVLISSFLLSFGSVLASSRIHLKMLDNILKAPMSFFDTTPLGRIVNRFSKDIYLIDEIVPRSLTGFMRTFFMTLTTLFIIIYSTPIFGTVIVPILLMYWFVQRFYIRTSRQLKRLESISRSPIYSHFSETLADTNILQGASTIRAYSLQKSFIKQNEMKIDTNQTAYYPNIVSNRWLALRLEIVGNLVVLFAAIFAVLQKGTIEAGKVGLSISYAMQVTSIMNWMVRSASEVETNIVSVERVEEYSNIEQEAPLIVESHRPPRNWPEVGEIAFQNYSTRYRPELDLVVKDINVDIRGGEKIGVVGRTGAGKSSLTLALFRIIESAAGRIRIDGLDISKMGLHSLRSKISIIPQDPVLFSGTLRMNLDPFETYPDDELWDALEHSHLKNFVSGLPTKLEHPISEGGENLSVGQRQLVCLARALLRKSQILVLDEATAAVDLETDDLIQATIRVQFAHSTTFTIAHRINTIMDSSRVLVLDAGKVAEYDTAENLLKSRGIFYSMAKDAGLA